VGIPAVARAVAKPAAGGLMPRNFLPNVRFAPDTVAKVENRTTPKISRKLILGRLYR
jgi:hypothetical protein